MRLIEPILFPITVYPLEIFKFAGENNIQKFDILCNFGYQSNHLDLVNKYIDPTLVKSLIDVLDDDYIYSRYRTETMVDMMDALIGKGKYVYEHYYRYFLTSYILETNRYEHSIDTLKWWTNEDKDYTFKKCFKYNKKLSIENYYNTIIIPRLWDKVQLNNVTWINLMYGLLPISFTQFKTIKLAGEHLMEGGNMYILRPEDYGKTFWELGDDFELKMDKDPWCFTKKQAPKKPKTNEINWL